MDAVTVSSNPVSASRFVGEGASEDVLEAMELERSTGNVLLEVAMSRVWDVEDATSVDEGSDDEVPKAAELEGPVDNGLLVLVDTSEVCIVRDAASADRTKVALGASVKDTAAVEMLLGREAESEEDDDKRGLVELPVTRSVSGEVETAWVNKKLEETLLARSFIEGFTIQLVYLYRGKNIGDGVRAKLSS
jgi:hypothetical protein